MYVSPLEMEPKYMAATPLSRRRTYVVSSNVNRRDVELTRLSGSTAEVSRAAAWQSRSRLVLEVGIADREVPRALDSRVSPCPSPDHAAARPLNLLCAT